MKILGLLRHAKSEWDDMATRDFDRGLNDRGRRGAKLIGDHIRNHGISWDVLVASSAARVKATLQGALPQCTPAFEDRLYLASPETIMETATRHASDADANAVLMAGHNPGLHELLVDLVSPAHENDLFHEALKKFPTATFAVLECDIDDWSQLRSRCATLVHFARPRDLDPELGPEPGDIF